MHWISVLKPVAYANWEGYCHVPKQPSIYILPLKTVEKDAYSGGFPLFFEAELEH